jgi:hypothetical protein
METRSHLLAASIYSRLYDFATLAVAKALLLLIVGVSPATASITSICNSPRSSIEQLRQDPLLRSFFEKTCGVQLAPPQPIREGLPALEPFEIAPPPASGTIPPVSREVQMGVLERDLTKTPESQRPPRETLVQVMTPELNAVPRAPEASERPKDSLTLDSAYFAGDMRDNYSYKPFILEVQRGSNRLFEEIHNQFLPDTTAGVRGAFFVGATVFSNLLAPNSYHEWGHFSRQRAMGSVDSKLHLGVCDNCDPIGGDSQFFRYWLRELRAPGSSAYVSYSQASALSANPLSGAATNVIYQGAGINNDVYLAEAQDEEFFFDERPLVFGVGFNLKSRVMTLLYQGESDLNDLNQLIDSYRTTGVDARLALNDIYQAHYWTLLSGSNISALRAAYRYIAHGRLVYEPLMIGSFLIPNQSNYYSSRGLTRKIQSGYRFSQDTKLVFGIEYVERGEPFRELNFGAYRRHGPWTVLGKLTVGDYRYTNLEFRVGRRITRYVELGLYGAAWDSRSLLGERNTLLLRKDKTSQGGIRLSYIY